jgi:hypothetical protein
MAFFWNRRGRRSSGHARVHGVQDGARARANIRGRRNRKMSTLAMAAQHEAPPHVRRALRPDDELVFPLSKGAFAQYWEEPGAPRELRLFYQDKEVAFNDPALFPFGEALAGRTRFRAGEATAWGPLAWPRVRGLLEPLVAAGILRHADEVDVPDLPRHEARPSPLAPAPCAHPPTWDDEGQTIRAISGKPLDPGHLELVVPVFRVAHMYLDTDDRQIGEANVFPPLARLDRPTLWRTCPYSGTRYQPDKPMNVTALRAMREQWRQVLAIVRRVSDSYRLRYPAVEARGWTVGDVERMTVCVLALPAYLLVRGEERVANGRLHPALSSAFRLTDGPRMVMHSMLFERLGEPARSGDTPITGDQAHAYAERNRSFHTGHGVCAGPPAMIDDFLAVLLDRADPRGGWPDRLDPEVEAALAVLEPAMDYGLLGLQAFGAVFSTFPAMSQSHAALSRVVRGWSGPESPRLASFRAALEGLRTGPKAAGDSLASSRLATYDAIYRECGFGLTGRPAEPSLVDRYANPAPLPADIAGALESAFARYLDDLDEGGALIAGLAACLGRAIATVQAALRTALEVQGRINALLGRTSPLRTFQGRDLVRYAALNKSVPPGRERKPVPFLIDDLARILGIAIEIDAEKVTIVRAT